MITSFKKWVENIEAERAGIQRDIFDFLKDELNITSEDELMTLNTADISEDVRRKLAELGAISRIPDAANAVKNGVTIEELIDIITQSSPSSGVMKHPAHKPLVVTAKQPEQQVPAQTGQ